MVALEQWGITVKLNIFTVLSRTFISPWSWLTVNQARYSSSADTGPNLNKVITQAQSLQVNGPGVE